MLIRDQIRRHKRNIFSIFYNIKVFCVFTLESPQRGGSNENTQYTIVDIKKKIALNYPKSAAMRFFKGTQKRIRNSHGKRAISVRATEVLLYCDVCIQGKQYWPISACSLRSLNRIYTVY